MHNSSISLVIPVGSISSDSVALYFQKRSELGHLGGLWEFPGGKIEAGEKAIEAARREYQEECGVEVGKLIHFKEFSFEYGNKALIFNCYLTRCDNPIKQFREFKFDLSTRSKKYKNSFPPANYELIDEVIEYLIKNESSGELDKIWM